MERAGLTGSYNTAVDLVIRKGGDASAGWKIIASKRGVTASEKEGKDIGFMDHNFGKVLPHSRKRGGLDWGNPLPRRGGVGVGKGTQLRR